MRLKLMIPNKTILDELVNKITAPGTEGSFQILPKHIDVVWGLQPGILIIDLENQERYYAIDQGVLVKQGDYVYISCFNAIKGDSLDELELMVKEKFHSFDEREKKAREVLVKLEMDMVRRYSEIET
ncbi:MAG: F0F1 ATP synthase subunit epsilon [Halanaerobiales bacterium]